MSGVSVDRHPDQDPASPAPSWRPVPQAPPAPAGEPEPQPLTAPAGDTSTALAATLRGAMHAAFLVLPVVGAVRAITADGVPAPLAILCAAVQIGRAHV